MVGVHHVNHGQTRGTENARCLSRRVFRAPTVRLSATSRATSCKRRASPQSIHQIDPLRNSYFLEPSPNTGQHDRTFSAFPGETARHKKTKRNIEAEKKCGGLKRCRLPLPQRCVKAIICADVPEAGDAPPLTLSVLLLTLKKARQPGLYASHIVSANKTQKVPLWT